MYVRRERYAGHQSVRIDLLSYQIADAYLSDLKVDSNLCWPSKVNSYMKLTAYIISKADYRRLKKIIKKINCA